ncbi:SYF2 splicing factor [Sphaeroforma arctica JP610]|uniref:Pre-mRNA-splicing factor SYF2 n=1 Tax=Sphaeroforma arctica JP610 TaxID=667725 RepID=A0A0L0F915_9EUKA|nr:SYF2 splicing factor [Sphaeroforma arctica JP610]KNC73212.1 SYF2 splicing factor [Sphaeroforma arctica JP610]|eukprot:XP_014147114.1 SYF2 splicing factor [Sphaeroforma arctica JP610]
MATHACILNHLALGFGDYITAGTQSYQRNVSNIRVDKEEYQARREIAGDNFYVGVNDLTVGALGDGRVDNVDRMVNDLEKRIEKRQKMSRRRAFDEDGDINYINERNMRFNQKAERYYGKHTQEIKDSLERGTAL